MSGVVISAWYMMLSSLQFPFIGHVFVLRQLQFVLFSSVLEGLDFFISALLWLIMMFSTLLIQL